MSEKIPDNHMDHTWQIRMQILMKRMRNMEVAQIIDEAIWKYYFDKGLEVPNWRMKKDPQWWTDYLESLDKKE